MSLHKNKDPFEKTISLSAQEKLQSPLQVLMCLAVENGPNLSAVRDYFLQVFQKDNESAKNVSKPNSADNFLRKDKNHCNSPSIISGRRIGGEISQRLDPFERAYTTAKRTAN